MGEGEGEGDADAVHKSERMYASFFYLINLLKSKIN